MTYSHLTGVVNRSWIAAFLAATSTLLSGCGGLKKDDATDQPVQELDVREVFLKANQSCPIRMDAFVTLQEVNMTDVSNVEFLYEVNEKGTPAFKLIDEAKIKDGIVNRVKSGSMSRIVVDSDIMMRHAYFSTEGELLGEYVIDQYDLTGKSRPSAEEKNEGQTDQAGPPLSNSAVGRQIELINRYKEIEKAVYAFRDGMTVEQWEAENGVAESEADSGEIPVEELKDEEVADAERTETLAADSIDQQSEEIVEGEVPVEPIEPIVQEPEMPQAIKMESKSKSNPAGIQSNPFFKD